MWCATLKLRRHDLWHLRKIAGGLEVDGRLCSAAFVQVGDAQVITIENVETPFEKRIVTLIYKRKFSKVLLKKQMRILRKSF